MKHKVYSKTNLILSHLISFLISPYYKVFNLFRKKHKIENIKINKILILEYHRIGDLIIILPALRSIKKFFPNSELILVCCKSSYDLIKHFNVADRIIPVEIPWTNWSFSLNKWIKTFFLIKKLKNSNIDLAFDFKGDLRNNWFLWKIKSKISFGYHATGGSFFLTNSFNFNHNKHQKDRAEELITKVGCLPLKNKEKIKLNKNGRIVIHPGSSDIRRSWSEKKWIKLINLISDNFKVAIVKAPESIEMIYKIKQKISNLEIFENDIVGFKIWLEKQSILIGVDSMAGHLAAELGIPTITIFGSQEPNLTSPTGKLSLIAKPKEDCKHDRNHWRLCSYCIDEVTEEYVVDLIKALMTQIKNNKNSV